MTRRPRPANFQKKSICLQSIIHSYMLYVMYRNICFHKYIYKWITWHTDKLESQKEYDVFFKRFASQILNPIWMNEWNNVPTDVSICIEIHDRCVMNSDLCISHMIRHTLVRHGWGVSMKHWLDPNNRLDYLQSMDEKTRHYRSVSDEVTHLPTGCLATQELTRRQGLTSLWTTYPAMDTLP